MKFEEVQQIVSQPFQEKFIIPNEVSEQKHWMSAVKSIEHCVEDLNLGIVCSILDPRY